MTPEERDQLAAEHVLGTLDADERARALALIDADPAFAAAVRFWEDRLHPLQDRIAPVTPPAALWPRIEAKLGGNPAIPTPDRRESLAISAGGDDVVDLTRRLRVWRGFSAAVTALAAGLAAVIVIDRLPEPAPPASGRYVAVVNSDGSLPALIVDVDTTEGVVTVRPVAAEQPSDRNLELWAIAEGGTPVSLGVFDPKSPVLRIRPDRAGVIPTRGLFAVSVEPVGGSPTGAPTGPVVYSGSLVPTAE